MSRVIWVVRGRSGYGYDVNHWNVCWRETEMGARLMADILNREAEEYRRLRELGMDCESLHVSTVVRTFELVEYRKTMRDRCFYQDGPHLTTYEVEPVPDDPSVDPLDV